MGRPLAPRHQTTTTIDARLQDNCQCAPDPGWDRNDPHDAQTAGELCLQSAAVTRRALRHACRVSAFRFAKPSFGIKPRIATQPRRALLVRSPPITWHPLFDRLFDEPERVGVLDQRSHLRAFETTRYVRLDLEPELHLAARQRRELLDYRLDNLMDVPGRPLR
jgi:hypothetical protein